MKTHFLTALIIVSSLSAQSQTTDSLKHKWKISEASLLLGSTRGGITPLSMGDYQNLLPESLILQNAMVPSSVIQKSHLFGSTVSSVNLAIGLTSKDGKGTLRLGFLYQGQGSTAFYMNETAQTGLFDTLTSSATGETCLIDSTRRETYFMDTRMEHIGLDVSMVYSTHYLRLNFFGGFGLTGSASLNSRTMVSHVAITEFDQDYDTYTLQQNDVIETEIIKHKSTFQGLIYIPVGIDLTLGKKRPILAHTSLHLELRPSLKLQQLPDNSVHTSIVSSSFLGFKYHF